MPEVGGWHPTHRVVTGDAREDFACRQLGLIFLIEPQVGLPLRAIGPVAGKTILGENGADVAIEIDREHGSCQQRKLAQEETLLQAFPSISAARKNQVESGKAKSIRNPVVRTQKQARQGSGTGVVGGSLAGDERSYGNGRWATPPTWPTSSVPAFRASATRLDDAAKDAARTAYFPRPAADALPAGQLDRCIVTALTSRPDQPAGAGQAC